MASMWDPAGRRSSIQLIADMLRLVRSGEPGKTELMSAVNMSYTQIQRYLSWMTRIGMLDTICQENNVLSYKITPKGVRLLSNIESLQEMLRRRKEVTSL